MSKVKIQGNASGTGVVTLTAPNTNTDRTITLPDSTGSILDSTSTLDATKLSGNLPAIDGSALTGMPAGGKVLQVVSVDYAPTFATNSTGYVDTGLTATITPLFSTSKIFVTASIDVNSSSSVPDARAYVNIMRGSTQIDFQLTGAYVGGSSNFTGYGRHCLEKLDNPSTTSATTYKVQSKVINTNCLISTGGDSTANTITLMEIGA